MMTIADNKIDLLNLLKRIQTHLAVGATPCVGYNKAHQKLNKELQEEIEYLEIEVRSA